MVPPFACWKASLGRAKASLESFSVTPPARPLRTVSAHLSTSSARSELSRLRRLTWFASWRRGDHLQQCNRLDKLHLDLMEHRLKAAQPAFDLSSFLVFQPVCHLTISA